MSARTLTAPTPVTVATSSGVPATRRLAAIVVFGAALVSSHAVLAQAACLEAEPSPALPLAVELRSEFSPASYSQAVQGDFDCFSWASFAALN